MISDNIRQYREKFGLNQKQMADKLCMTVTGYGKIERGEVSVNEERMKNIADIFNISTSELLEKKNNDLEKSEIFYLRSLILEKDKRIENLEREVSFLYKTLKIN